MRESVYQQGGGDGAAKNREGNGPASARGPVSQYLQQPSLANEESKRPSTRTTEQQQVTTGEVNISTAHVSTENVLQATPQQLREWQQVDPTLKTIRELADSWEQAEGEAKFCYQVASCTDSGLLMQLVLPQQCRPAVLQLAHDVPAVGHLGINKTRSRVLCRYYWPGVFKDVANHCRSCEVCQRNPGGNCRISCSPELEFQMRS